MPADQQFMQIDPCLAQRVNASIGNAAVCLTQIETHPTAFALDEAASPSPADRPSLDGSALSAGRGVPDLA